LTKVFETLYNPFMAKQVLTKKVPALSLKSKSLKITDAKLPFKVNPGKIDWKKIMPKSSSPILVALLVIAAFLIGVLFTKVQYLEKGQPTGGANQQAAAPAANPQQGAPAAGAKVNVAVGNFPVKGDPKAKVTIIEFADFRCPFCEQFFSQTEPQILKDYVDTGKVRFAFRNFAFLGPASVVAANASECANDQGKFWEFYDYLYKNQPSESDTSMYNVDTLSQAAVSLGMDGTAFANCLNNKTDDAKAAKDLSDGQAAGVNGTPSFFINGVPIVGAEPYSSFKTIIDQELAKAK
jgi:protein-disulfide isomerase